MILIAGATGHLGTALVELLTLHGRRVRLLTRDPSRARRLLAKDHELVTGDVCKPPSLTSALVGVETVVSAVTGFGPGGGGPRAVDLHGNENLIAAAEAAEVKHFILVSMYGARPDHPLELYRAKFFAEERLRKSRLAWTIIRPTVFMELWAGIVGDSLIKNGKATVFGRGDNPINLVSVRDVARFVEMAVVDPRLRGTTLDVGGPENLTLNDVVETLAATSGRPATARHISLTALRVGSLLMRPLKPDLAGLIRAAILMDTIDMSLDPGELAAGYPEIALTHLADVVRGKYAHA
ncbi:MAG TPA: SDR family oxidoreductase [Candidatus Dormibacteraeota bacterium]